MKKISLILIIWLVSGVGMTHAVDQYTLLEPLPCIAGVSVNCVPGTLQKEIDINNYFLYIYKFAIAASVFLAIVMIIWGGFQYITSEVPFLKTDGKAKITNAVSGLAMVLVSYLILQTIDPRLVSIDANLPAININNTGVKEYIDYQTKLADELTNLNTQNKVEQATIATQIAELNKDKQNLQKNGSDTQAIDIKIKELESQKVISRASEIGLSRFIDATKIFNSTTYDRVVDRDADIANHKNIINNQYNAQIQTLKNINNTSADKIQLLQRQRDYYTAQIQEQVVLISNIKSDSKYKVANFNSEPVIERTKYLQSRLEAYNTIKKDSAFYTGLGITKEQIDLVYDARIESINMALKK